MHAGYNRIEINFYGQRTILRGNNNENNSATKESVKQTLIIPCLYKKMLSLAFTYTVYVYCILTRAICSSITPRAYSDGGMKIEWCAPNYWMIYDPAV